MAHCWNCFHEEDSEHGCWVCDRARSKNYLRQDERSAKEDNSSSQHSSIPNNHGSAWPSNIEKPAQSYDSPYTSKIAQQSIDTIDHHSPVLPKEFAETSNTAEFDGPKNYPPPSARPYSTSVHNFDFSDDGGPVISMIRTSGTRQPQSPSTERTFGSIEIVPAEDLPAREKEVATEEKPPSAKIDVEGWRRGLLVGSVLAGMFLGFLDTTIVSVGKYRCL